MFFLRCMLNYLGWGNVLSDKACYTIETQRKTTAKFDKIAISDTIFKEQFYVSIIIAFYMQCNSESKVIYL